MNVVEKLDILSRDAQYDLSCACGTKNPAEHRKKSTGDTWLYPVTVANGGTGIMLKTLMSNVCTNDCLYCPLRNTMDTRRVGLIPDELASFFMDLQRKRKLIGMFLSSGVIGSPDATMEKLTATAEILRKKYQYRGYVHIKIIPGSSTAAIDKALSLASAVSLNIETPGAKFFSKLSEKKQFETDIIEPLKYIAHMTANDAPFAKIHKTSQFIVGASDESDRDILSYTWAMYKKLSFHRLYFSAYQSGLGDPSIPGEQNRIILPDHIDDQTLFPFEPRRKDGSLLIREHRLYQADYLFRQYGFSFDDLLFEQAGNLDLNIDPKQLWANRHPEFFPVSLSKASKEELLRVPGLGPISVGRILKARKCMKVRSLDTLKIPQHLVQKAETFITH